MIPCSIHTVYNTKASAYELQIAQSSVLLYVRVGATHYTVRVVGGLVYYMHCLTFDMWVHHDISKQPKIID